MQQNLIYMQMFAGKTNLWILKELNWQNARNGKITANKEFIKNPRVCVCLQMNADGQPTNNNPLQLN